MIDNTITPAAFDTMSDDPRWGGFGYLGERRNRLESTDPEAPAHPDRVAAVDAAVVQAAASRGWDYEQLFTWANSRNGRHFGDAVYGTDEPVAKAVDRAVNQWRLLTY